MAAAVDEITGDDHASPVPALPVVGALGRDHGVLHLPGAPLDLSRRHTEILVLLATRPHGMTIEELAVAIYGDTGRPREAAQRYPALLLPRSEAPGIPDVRVELDTWVRSAVMASGDREALWRWVESPSGSADLPAWKRFLTDVDFPDPRRALAVSRMVRLRDALAVAA